MVQLRRDRLLALDETDLEIIRELTATPPLAEELDQRFPVDEWAMIVIDESVPMAKRPTVRWNERKQRWMAWIRFPDGSPTAARDRAQAW